LETENHKVNYHKQRRSAKHLTRQEEIMHQHSTRSNGGFQENLGLLGPASWVGRYDSMAETHPSHKGVNLPTSVAVGQMVRAYVQRSTHKNWSGHSMS